MNVEPIIARLKAKTTTLGGRIAGAAEFGIEVEAARMALPCAFVMRASGTASDAATLGEVVQTVLEEFGIAIAIDNNGDARGQEAAKQLDEVMRDIRRALLGWIPDPGVDDDGPHNAFEIVSDAQIAIDRGRLWHQYVWRTSTTYSSVAS